jgi:hypothetical protein
MRRQHSLGRSYCHGRLRLYLIKSPVEVSNALASSGNLDHAELAYQPDFLRGQQKQQSLEAHACT